MVSTNANITEMILLNDHNRENHILNMLLSSLWAYFHYN